MDRAPFIPPVLALFRGVGLILSVAFGSITVKYGVQKYGHAEVPTSATSPVYSYQVPTVATFGQDAEPCLTCRFADTNGRLLDYYGQPIDIDELLANKPSSSHTRSPAPRLTVASPAPSSPLSTDPSPTPFASHGTLPPPSSIRTLIPEFLLPQGLSNSEIILSWIELILAWWISPFHNYVDATNAAKPGDTISRIRSIVWLLAYRLALAIVRKAAVAWFHYLRKALKIRKTLRAKVTSSNTTEDSMAEHITKVTHQHSQDAAGMMSTADACTLKTAFEEAEARRLELTVGPSNEQAECPDGSVEKAISLEEDGAGLQPSEEADGIPEKSTGLEGEDATGEAQESGGPTKSSTDPEQSKAADEEPEQQADLQEKEEEEETTAGTLVDPPVLENQSSQQATASGNTSPSSPNEPSTPPEPSHLHPGSDPNPTPEEPSDPAPSDDPNPDPDPDEEYLMPERFRDRSDSDLEADEGFRWFIRNIYVDDWVLDKGIDPAYSYWET